MSSIKSRTAAILAIGLAVSAAPAHAQQQGPAQANAAPFVFEGTRQIVNPLLPPGSGRCSPPNFNTVEIAPGKLVSTGTSNLGGFGSTQSHCIVTAPPTQVTDGRFTYTFRAGDSISGTYTGRVALTGTPGTFEGIEDLVITGGTGRFAGASGTLSGRGSLFFANGNGNFSGTTIGTILAPTTTASGASAVALGVPAAATGDYSTAVGAFSIASGKYGVATGALSEATAEGAVAVGGGANASGMASMALGQFASTTAPAASAVGHNSVASGLGAFAGGVRAQATNVGATSIGRLSGASGANATALGAGATAAFDGSTAIGAGASTTVANQVMLGGRGASVRLGDTAASTAAQTGPLNLATVDGAGTLGRGVDVASLATASQVGALQSGQATLFDLAEVNRRDIRRANEGVALALAMETPQLPPGSRFAISGGVGYFRDRTAGTFAFAARLGEKSAVTGGVGVGFRSGGVGARAGLQHAW